MIPARQEEGTLVTRATVQFSRFRAGDRSGFDDLVGTLTPLMWQTVRSAGVDRVRGEDVIQTVWMSLLRSAATIQDPRAVVKWVLTSTKRESWRQVRLATGETRRSGAVFGVDDEEVMSIPEQRQPQPDEAVELSARQRTLWSHVRALPERCRALISVIAFADKPDYALIAESLGMPVGSIGPTRGRCLAKLRTELAMDPQWEGLTA